MTSLFRCPSLYFLLILAGILSLFPGYSYYRQLSYSPVEPAYRELPNFFSDQRLALYPVRDESISPPELSAEGVFVIDVESAVPMFEKDAHRPLYPASTTKLMTALLARQLYDLDEILDVPEATYSGSLMIS